MMKPKPPNQATIDAVLELSIYLAFWWLFVIGGLGWLWRWMTEEKQ